MVGDAAERSATGSLAAAVSDRLVRMLAAYMGRGPSKARAVIGSDYILVFLSDTLTRWERSLMAAGHGDIVLQLRSSIYDAMRPDAISAVQELAGRDVTCFLADSQIEPDLSIALFVLASAAEPAGPPDQRPARASTS